MHLQYILSFKISYSHSYYLNIRFYWITTMNYHNQCPKKFDSRIKKLIINQNIYHSLYGNYRDCPTNQSIKFFYKDNHTLPEIIDKTCKVIVQNHHSLDLARTMCHHTTSTKQIPAIMYPIGNFLGTNFESHEDSYDENILLRTNYPGVIKKQNELFPLDNNIVYSNPITIIRDENYGPLDHYDVFKVAVITCCTKNDLVDFQMCVETVFQAAIHGSHNILILTPFDEKSKIPCEDQIVTFNNLILKYMHKFKEIIVCVPPYEDKKIYDLFNEKIIKYCGQMNEI